MPVALPEPRWLAVADGVCAALLDCEAVRVDEGDCDDEPDCVGVHAPLAEPVPDPLCVPDVAWLGLADPEGVAAWDAERVWESDDPKLGVCEAVAHCEAVADEDGEGVAVVEAVLEGVAACDADWDGEAACVDVCVSEALGDGEGVSVDDGVCEAVADAVWLWLGVEACEPLWEGVSEGVRVAVRTNDVLCVGVGPCDGVELPETVGLWVCDCEGVGVCVGVGEQSRLRALSWTPAYDVSTDHEAPASVETSAPAGMPVPRVGTSPAASVASSHDTGTDAFHTSTWKRDASVSAKK